jgi:hypothetical protein
MEKNPTQKSKKIKSFLVARSCPQLKIIHATQNNSVFGA